MLVYILKFAVSLRQAINLPESNTGPGSRTISWRDYLLGTRHGCRRVYLQRRLGAAGLWWWQVRVNIQVKHKAQAASQYSTEGLSVGTAGGSEVCRREKNRVSYRRSLIEAKKRKKKRKRTGVTYLIWI